MNRALEEFVLNKEQKSPSKVKRIGGGYYADVFKFDYKGRAPIIVKVYKTEDVMVKEAAQVQILREHSLFPMPEILWTHFADEKFPYDLMTMNFLQGENGGRVNWFSSAKRRKLAEQVTDGLLQFHSVHNPKGFGEINGDRYYETFNEYYRERVAAILKMAEALHKRGELSDYVYGVAVEAVKQFDKIFYLPITEASLIHGDYNMWNIMVDRRHCKVTAIIDPCGCMWADNEYDLYQLDNANGKKLKLFGTYAEKKQLSENHPQKMAFYKLFAEIEHYYKSNHHVVQKLIKIQADSLNEHLEKTEK